MPKMGLTKADALQRIDTYVKHNIITLDGYKTAIVALHTNEKNTKLLSQEAKNEGKETTSIWREYYSRNEDIVNDAVTV